MTTIPSRVVEKPSQAPSLWLDLLRFTVVGLAAIVLQTSVAANVGILGAHPDFVLIVVVCVALLRGAEAGAVFGFVVGGLASIPLFEPAGIGAFVMVVVGYLAGRYAETVDLSPGILPIVTVLATSLLGETLYALAQFLLERQAPAYFIATHVIVPQAVLNTLLAAPVFLVVHWLFGGERHARVLETR